MSSVVKICSYLTGSSIFILSCYYSYRYFRNRQYSIQLDILKVEAKSCLTKPVILGPANKLIVKDMKLRAVVTFCRHGARTGLRPPIFLAEDAIYDKKLVEKLPNTDVNFLVKDVNGGPTPRSAFDDYHESFTYPGGCHLGTLTTIGQQQLFKLGCKYGIKYRELIKPEPLQSTLYVRTSAMQRNYDSTRCFLAGFCQANNIQLENPFIADSTVDSLEILYPSQICSQLNLIRSHGYLEGNAKFKAQPLYDSILNILGLDPKTTKYSLIQIRDELVCRMGNKLPFPDALTDKMIDFLNMAAGQIERDATCSPHERNVEVLKLSAGPLLHLLITNFKEVLSGKSEKNIFTYVAHDSTLIPILVAMGCFDGCWPLFAAHLTTEMYMDKKGGIGKDSAFFRVLYNDNVLKIPLPCNDLKTGLIPYKDFMDYLAPISTSPEDWQSACFINELSSAL